MPQACRERATLRTCSCVDTCTWNSLIGLSQVPNLGNDDIAGFSTDRDTVSIQVHVHIHTIVGGSGKLGSSLDIADIPKKVMALPMSGKERK